MFLIVLQRKPNTITLVPPQVIAVSSVSTVDIASTVSSVSGAGRLHFGSATYKSNQVDY